MTIDRITEEKIIRGYDLFNGNAVKAANYAEVTPPTVRRKWKENNLATDIHRNKALSDDDKFLILNAYYCFDGHGKEMSENLSWCLSTIWKVCRGYGLKLKGKIRPEKIRQIYDRKKREKIARIYVWTGYNAAETARIYGCSIPTVRRIAGEKGISTLRHRRIKKSKLENL